MRTIALMICFLFAVIIASSQQRLTGIVRDAQNQSPLLGVVVQNTSSLKTTLTDSFGRFTMYADTLPVTLHIKHLGYKAQSITAITKSILTIALEPESALLDNVVVSTGYQQLPRERTTGSFAFVSEKELNMQPGANILDRLTGITSSLNVSVRQGHPPLTVRGLSTISGPKTPLIVLDNFPYEGDITNINPADIESVTVLKDAAAASVWGARAGNGVIVITSKKPKFSSPLAVLFTANTSITAKPDLGQFKIISSAEQIDIEKFLFSKGFYNTNENAAARPALSPVVEALIAVRDGKWTNAQADSLFAQLAQRDVRAQYDRIYKPALAQQYALVMRGGSADISSVFSVGFDNRSTELSATSRRITLRSENKIKLHKNITLNAGITYTDKRSVSGQNGYGSVNINTTQQLYPYADLNEPLCMFRKTYIDTAGAGKLLDWNYYPLQEAALNKNISTTNDFLLNTGAEINLTKGLRLDLKFQSEKQSTNGETLHDINSYFTRNQINRFTQIDKVANKITYIVPKAGILDRSDGALSSLSGRAQLNYDRKIGAARLTALAGAEARKTDMSSSAGRTYGYNPDNLSVIPVDLANTYPIYITGSKAQLSNTTDFTKTYSRFISAFANAGYTWKSKYVLTASARKDAANIFGLSANDKWRPLWSAGFAWDIAKEQFYKSDLIPSLKLRFTYGQSGNVDNSKTALTTIAYTGNGSITNFPYASIRQYANPELRWEKVATLNAGIDFEIATLIDGSLEYYRKRSSDLYGSALIDYTAGAGDRIIKNIADLQTSGIDLNLHFAWKQSGDWQFFSDLLLSYNHDKVIHNFLSTQQASSFVSGGLNVSAVEGRPVYALYSYPWLGLDPATGSPIGIINGQSSMDYTTLTGSKTLVSDIIYQGPVIPVYFGSLRSEIKFKSFSLQWLFSYKGGHWFRRPSLSYGQIFNGTGSHSDFTQRWLAPGDEQRTTVPSMIYPNVSARDNFYNATEEMAEHADHIRLQFLRFSYAAKRFTGFIHASDLGILWKKTKTDYDPEYYGGLTPRPTFTAGIQFNYR